MNFHDNDGKDADRKEYCEGNEICKMTFKDANPLNLSGPFSLLELCRASVCHYFSFMYLRKQNLPITLKTYIYEMLSREASENIRCSEDCMLIVSDKKVSSKFEKTSEIEKRIEDTYMKILLN